MTTLDAAPDLSPRTPCASESSTGARRSCLRAPRPSPVLRLAAPFALAFLLVFATAALPARAAAARTQAVAPAGSWGGDYVTPGGETVRIFSSDAYAEEPARNQRWADFLGSLIHGSELGSVTVYLVAPREVSAICGFGGLACYAPFSSRIIAPGEDVPGDASAETILTHEYGHHVAANRLNPPWEAVDYGTKRWASYVNICAKTAAGALQPGDQDAGYELNPGEAFAEAYRVLNETRTGRTPSPWTVVDQSLYPDETALRLLEQDVTQPWTRNTSTTRAGALRVSGARNRAFSFETPLDGSLRLSLRAPARSAFRLELLAGGKRLARALTTPGRRTATVTTTVCGTRSAAARVTRVRGGGQFRLAVSRP